MDLYDKEKRKFDESHFEEIQLSTDKQAVEAGMLEAEYQYNLHQASAFKPGLFTHKDSQSMILVKEAETNLMDFYRKTSFDPSYRTIDLNQLNGHYNTLINRCNEYIDSHKNPRTASGKARKQMVLQILKTANYEYLHLDFALNAAAKSLSPDGTWMQVLGVLRTANIDVSEHKLEKASGSTSDLDVITYNDNTKLYYKKEELLHSMKTDLRLQLANTPVCKKHAKVFEKLIDHVSETNYRSVTNISLSQYIDWSTLATVDPDFLSDFTLKEQKELQKILPAFSPVFSKIYIRYGIAAEAKIDENRRLASRNIATTRMANLLGLSGLVADSVSVRLYNSKQDPSKDTILQEVTQEEDIVRIMVDGTIDHTEENLKKVPHEIGIASVMAKGATIHDIISGGKPVEASPEVVRELINLQLLDNLCGQVDRNPSNLYFTYDETDEKRVLTHVTAIDSDMSFGCLQYRDLTQTKDGLGQLLPVEFGEECKLAVMDEEVCERILALKSSNLFYFFGDIINQKEENALYNRLDGLQKMILKNREKLKSGAWTKEDAKAIVRHFEKTYLSKISSLIRPF